MKILSLFFLADVIIGHYFTGYPKMDIVFGVSLKLLIDDVSNLDSCNFEFTLDLAKPKK